MLVLLSVVLTAASSGSLERDFPNAKLFVRPGESTVSMAIDLDAPFPDVTTERARAFLQLYGGAFGLRAEDELVLRSRRGDELLTTIRFDRRKAGVTVYGAELTLTFDKDSRLVMIHAGPQVPPARGAWKLPSSYALEREPDATEVEAAWVRLGDVLRPGWIVTRVLPEGPTSWVSVDAENGAVLERRRIAWTVNGRVFDYSPVRSSATTLCAQQPDAGYASCATSSLRTLGNLVTGATSLSGPRAVARNCRGAASGTNCLPRATPTAGAFDYPADLTTSSMDSFGEVMAYYQADRYSAWLDTLSPPFQAGGGLGVVDVFTNIGGYEGGFFQASGPFNRFGIRLGQGPVADWAYDADVLWHELGHGLVQRTSQFGFYSRDAQGLYGDSGALNEGTADCDSLAFKGSPQLGENAGSRLMEDGQTTVPYLRTVESKRMCQITSVDGATTLATGGRVGEIHADGVIWGSFFWALRQRTASISTTSMCANCSAAEIILTRALESLGSSASFNDAALAVQQVAASLFGEPAGQLVGCLNCEWDMAGCADRTRIVFANETHEALLVDSSAGSYGGVTPADFQYVIAVPANTQLLFSRFLIESGSLTMLARFGSKVTWNGTTHNATNSITAQGQTLPAQGSAGNWYLQGAHDGAAIRKFGFRVNFASGTPPARPAPPVYACTLGGTFPSGCACTPQCSGKQCGSDGCGGTCGTCGANQMCSASSQCGCVPACTGKQCGPDGCGGICGMCAAGSSCTTAGTCACTPNCAGRMCGSDGCGGTCGAACPSGQACNNGLGMCVQGIDPCEGIQCGSDGDGGTCGACPQDFTCTAQGSCSSSAGVCGNKLCGPDGLGGSCGTCDPGEACTETGTCIVTTEMPKGCGCTSGAEGLQVLLAAWLLRRRRAA